MQSSYLLYRTNRFLAKSLTPIYFSSLVYSIPVYTDIRSTRATCSTKYYSVDSFPLRRSIMDQNASSSSLSSSSSSFSTSNLSSSASSAPTIIDSDDFTRIHQEMIQEDEKREGIIKRSRDLLKLSKQTIYETHRQGYSKAKEMIETAQSIAKELVDSVGNDYPQLRYGSLSNALEEYTEAIIFYHYLQYRTIPRLNDIPYINKEEYLGGLMDFTGELNRYAVLRATARDIQAVHHARDTLDIINSKLMLFDFRNGNLRRKYDGVKYTLRKLEQIIYELTLANSSMIIPKSGGMDDKILASFGSSTTNPDDDGNADGTNNNTMDHQGINHDEGGKEGDNNNEYTNVSNSTNRGPRRGGMNNAGGGNKRFRQ